MKTVAVLATGDEIVNGDILNTNSQLIAHLLCDHNINISLHMTVPDDRDAIADAINYLLLHCDALITIGGLGPTKDDCTRFGLSQAINTPLEFNDTCWERIVERFNKLNINIPDNNRQQALFPQHAVVIPNPRGSADACMVNYQKKMIFMLPGPPSECLPLVEEQVLPKLTKAHFSQKILRKSWLLLGVGEGDIANKIDNLLSEHDFDVAIGYRVAYPYIEVKLTSQILSHIQDTIRLIKSCVEPFLISEHKLTASQQLYHSLVKYPEKVIIEDNATGGLLASKLTTPATFNHVIFKNESVDEAANAIVKIQGLEAFWNEDDASTNTSLAISIKSAADTHIINKQIPYRGKRTLLLAVEIICWELCKHLTPQLSKPE